MCAGVIISLYKYVKLCTGGQGGKTMGNVRGWDVTEWGFFMRIYSLISKKVRKLKHLSDMVRQEYDRTCTVNGSY